MRDPYLRFIAKVDDSGGPDACHPWTARLNNKGYGVFFVGPKTQLASRWILGHLRGRPLGPDEQACHRCDNPPCVNPAHLYAGTRADNMRDMTMRNRHRNSTKTHCPQGHPYNEANTYVWRPGSRQCRTCTRIRQRKSN